MESVKIGLLPSYRFRYTEWCDKMRIETIDALNSIKHVQVIVPKPSPDGNLLDSENGYTPHGAVTNLDQAEVVAEYFDRQKVDGLVICPLDFGDERSSAKVAERLRIPVFLYATKEPPALDDPAMSRVSDSYCGTLSIASALHRRGIPFHFAGIFFPDEPNFAEELDIFARAVSVRKGLMGARIGHVGVRPPTFETVAYDEIAMARKFGQNVIFANISDITQNASEYKDDDERVQQVICEIKSSVQNITVADDYLINAAKLELALTDFWKRSRLSAMAVQCWPSIQRLMKISVCAIYGRLTGKHMLTACETDVLGVLTMLINYRASLCEDLPHFIDWTIQHRKDPNCLLAWHCGNAPLCLAKDPQKVALRSRRDMKGILKPLEADPMAGLYQFQLKPGKVTICRLAEYNEHWKLLVTTGEIVPSDEELSGTWGWVRVRDHMKLYRTLVEEGFIHHASLIHGDQTKALLNACKFLEIEPIVV